MEHSSCRLWRRSLRKQRNNDNPELENVDEVFEEAEKQGYDYPKVAKKDLIRLQLPTEFNW